MRSSNERTSLCSMYVYILCASTLTDMPCRNLFIVFPRMCILVYSPTYSPKNDTACRAVPFATYRRGHRKRITADAAVAVYCRGSASAPLPYKQ